MTTVDTDPQVMPNIPTTLAILTFCALSATGATSADSSQKPSLPYPTVTERLIISGAPVKISIAPVYDNKTWAFTTRWDDNNLNALNMQAAMAEIGLKGSFYLNGSRDDTAAAFARQLSTTGTSVGGHTTNHLYLTTANANTVFDEILFNRIERESETDTTLNSFAFPFGRFQEQSDPTALKRITLAWLNSGYHSSVYDRFILKNPHMPKGYASTVVEVKPGDRKINAGSFRRQMDKVLSNPSAAQTRTPVISVGVHPWQPVPELEKFKPLLAEYMGRDDFWYDTQTNVSAYRFQALHTKIEPIAGQTDVYTVTRPSASIAGAAVPLTLVLTGPKPEKITLNSQVPGSHVPSTQTLSVTPGQQPDTWLLNLPYPAYEATTSKIDWLSCGPGFAGNPHTASKFPGIEVELKPTDKGEWSLKISNHSNTELHNGSILLRLAPAYAQGVQFADKLDLKPKESTSKTFSGELASHDPIMTDGAEFAVAQLDFTQDGEACRLYAVYRGEADTTAQNCVRDAFASAGPFAPESIDLQQLVPFSAPDAALTPIGDTPGADWRISDSEQRTRFSRDLVTITSTEPAWRQYAKAFSRKPSIIPVVADFTLPEASTVTFTSALKIALVAIDGQEVTLENNATAELSAGPHRLLLVFNTGKQIPFWCDYPQELKVLANGKPVSWLPAPKTD